MKAESFEFLISSFNNGLVSSRDQADHLNLSSIVHELIEIGAFSQSKNQTSVMCPNCDEMHQVAINPSDFKGYCADTGIIEAKPEELISYVASSKWMLDNIRKSIDAPASNPAKELLDHQLWFVGYPCRQHGRCRWLCGGACGCHETIRRCAWQINGQQKT